MQCEAAPLGFRGNGLDTMPEIAKLAIGHSSASEVGLQGRFDRVIQEKVLPEAGSARRWEPSESQKLFGDA